MINKTSIRNFIGELPLAAELDYALRQKNRTRKDHYNLSRLAKSLPHAVEQVKPFVENAKPAKNILFFATLHYWIEQAAYFSLTLAGLGHKVTLLTLPYSEWHKEMDMDAPKDRALYDLRMKRNTFAARAALEWMQTHKPDVVLIPNGLILEMGIVFRVARYLNIPAVTFEFNDQREQIWLAQNTSIMRQDTDYLVEARCSLSMTETMYERLADLENARRGARVWGKSKRLWQYVSAQGAEQTRKALGLDERPIVLLAANVLGDSLTLGRNIFAESMSEWITRTVQFFASRPDIQLVIRVHPGEKLVPHAKSMGTVVREALSEIPKHIHLIGALDNVNTYDLIEIANLGLAYTTTVGVETAMNGIPVIACGDTHYRGRGFTINPSSWGEYFFILDKVLSDFPAYRLTEEQVAKAWNYAYLFFFEYPRPFPWRLM